jgi:hypothetical protein
MVAAWDIVVGRTTAEEDRVARAVDGSDAGADNMDRIRWAAVFVQDES